MVQELNLETNIQKFKQMCDLNEYNSFDVKLISLKKEEKYIVYLLEIFFRNASEKISLIKGLPNNSYIKAFHINYPIKKFDDFIEGILGGKINVKGKVFYLEWLDKTKIKSWFFDKVHPQLPYAEISMKAVRAFYDVPIIPNWHDKNVYDWALRGSKKPFYNLEIFANSMLYTVDSNKKAVVPIIDVIALPPIRFNYLADTFGFDNEKYYFTVIIPDKYDIDKVRLGINLYGKKGIIRKSTSIKKHIVSKKGSEKNIEINSEGHPTADFFLSYNNDCLAQKHIRSGKYSNPRMLLHGLYDGGLSKFKELIDPSNNQSKKFEKGIEMLLHFLGFQTEHLGGLADIKDEIDVVAFETSTGTLLLAECTVSTPNIDNKVGRFKRKVLQIQEMYKDNKLIVPKIVGAVFSSRARAQMADTELIQAGINNVAVIAKENIEELIDMAGWQNPTNSILEYIEGCIPENVIKK